MANHLATCGSIGFSGRRVGTTYIHTPRQAWAYQGEPWFRFRNDETERQCRSAWAEPAPMSGDFFDAVDDSEEPDIGHSSRAPDELTKCSLARYERDGIVSRGGRHLQQIGGDTDYFRWYQLRPDFCWYPMGRLLKLNAAGRAALVASKAEA